MKKILLLMSLLFLITGCNVKYNLYVDKNNLIEKVYFHLPNTTSSELKDIYNIYSDPSELGSGGYDLSLLENQKQILAINNQYTIVENNSNFIYNCYDDVNISITSNQFQLETSGAFRCYDLYTGIDNVEIVIHVDGNVTSNNADRIDGNNYIWNISQNNLTKKISLKVEEVKENEEIKDDSNANDNQEDNNNQNNESSTEENLTSSIFTILIVVAIVVVGILGIIVYFVMKNKEVNKL